MSRTLLIIGFTIAIVLGTSASGMKDENAPSAQTGTPNKVIFTDLAAAQALAEKGPAVLFFWASWCPTCRAALKDIDENGSRLGDITVVVVDYDKAVDLKARYGITYQHTFVQIDPSGAKRAIWSGGGVDDIIKRVSRG